MPGSTGSSSDRVQCPRCGYDLRSTVATWQNAGACPLEGTCTECGYAFLWRDVLRPTFGEPAWCVEYAPARVGAMLRAICTTFLQSWLPWSFWRRLRLHHEVRLRRIGLYLLAVAILPCVMIYVVSQTTAAIIVRSAFQKHADISRYPQAILDLEQRINDWKIYKTYEQIDIDARVDALRRAEFPVRPVLIEDGEQFDPSIHVPSQEEWEPYWRTELNRMNQILWNLHATVQNPPRVRMNYIQAIGEALFRPWATTSAGSLWTRSGVLPYPSPSQLYDHTSKVRQGHLPHPLFVPAFYPTTTTVLHSVEPISMRAGAVLILGVCYPIMLLALPITRRRARVLPVHFMRVTAYSFVIMLASLQVAGFLLLACWYFPDNSDSLLDAIRRIQALGLPVLLLVWWYCAIRLHLRLPNALAVTLILAILNVLVVGGAAFLIGWALRGL